MNIWSIGFIILFNIQLNQIPFSGYERQVTGRLKEYFTQKRE